ncbi:MAG: hypothetical protein ABFD50_11245 [Smithella sp.]
MKYHDYTGVIHFHSSYSFDGHIGLDEIIDAACKNNLNFMMLTDHDHLRARDEGREGWQGKVLLIIGEEIAPRFNHYLAFNIDRPVDKTDDPEGMHPQKYIDEVNAAGGFGFIAHPDHEGTKKFHVKHYPWMDWSVDGYAGISIWDFMTDWQASLKGHLTSLISFFFPAFFLRGPCGVTLERWDALNQTKKVVGIGELDNHGSKKKIGPIKFSAFSFNRAFKLIHTHICTPEPLTGNNEEDISIIYNSLQRGCCYAALDYFRSAKGFVFKITQDKEEYFMGDSLVLKDKADLFISLPAAARLRIIRNGTLYAQEINSEIELSIREQGIYRMEAHLKRYGKYRPWIFSNPIFVKQ